MFRFTDIFVLNIDKKRIKIFLDLVLCIILAGIKLMEYRSICSRFPVIRH